MGDYVHMSTPPISNADTRILGNILLDKPDRTRDYQLYAQYYYLVNGKFPTTQKGIIKRAYTFTKQHTLNWFQKLLKIIKVIRR